MIWTLAAHFFWVAQAAPIPILFRDIRVVDARGDQGVRDVWIQDGLIVGVDPSLVPEGVDIRDGQGLTLTPGLIDSHVHIAEHPGAMWLADIDAEETLWHRQYLRSYLAWGITTVVDPGITASDARAIQALSAEHGGPDIQLIGPLVGPKHGYPSAIFSHVEGVESPEELSALLDSYEGLDSRGLKITMEDGPITAIWPLFDEQMRRHIQIEAQRNDLPLYIHAMDAATTWAALEMNPHGLVHAPQTGGRRLVQAIRNSGVYVMTTTATVGGIEWLYDEPFWSDPHVVQGVPQAQLDQLATADLEDRMWLAGLGIYLPGLTERSSRRWARWAKRMVPGRIGKSVRLIGALHRAGVPLVLGTDAGGSPIVPWLVHGPSMEMEFRLMEQAGLSPLAILTAATWTPAQMLSMEEELGTIEVDKRADLLIVKGDPLSDASVLLRPRWVIRAGDCRTPQEWMESPK